MTLREYATLGRFVASRETEPGENYEANREIWQPNWRQLVGFDMAAWFWPLYLLFWGLFVRTIIRPTRSG